MRVAAVGPRGIRAVVLSPGTDLVVDRAVEVSGDELLEPIVPYCSRCLVAAVLRWRNP